LDLVVHVRGGGRADALRWCADLAGVVMDDTPLSLEDRARWARERRELEHDLPAARLWRRAAVCMTEDLIELLKAGLSTTVATTTPMQPEAGELMHLTKMLARLKGIDGGAVVAEYRAWLMHHPQLTAGMVRAARNLEAAELRLLHSYLGATEGAEAAA
jgi:hypothetical protein